MNLEPLRVLACHKDAAPTAINNNAYGALGQFADLKNQLKKHKCPEGRCFVAKVFLPRLLYTSSVPKK